MRNDGKDTEKIFDNLYKEEMALTKSFVFYKFIDTHAARNLVTNQPSDRLAIYNGQTYLVEIKSSNDVARFPLKNISSKQIGHAQRWSFAGAKSIFIIHRIPTNEFYFVPFSEVLAKAKSKKASWRWEELQFYKQCKEYKWWQV